MIQSYRNLYSKWVFASNGKAYGNGYLEVQIHRYPFHTGLRVLVTDGFKYLSDVHCSSIEQAKNEFRKIQKSF